MHGNSLLLQMGNKAAKPYDQNTLDESHIRHDQDHVQDFLCVCGYVQRHLPDGILDEDQWWTKKRSPLPNPVHLSDFNGTLCLHHPTSDGQQPPLGPEQPHHAVQSGGQAQCHHADLLPLLHGRSHTLDQQARGLERKHADHGTEQQSGQENSWNQSQSYENQIPVDRIYEN